jgi:hypothetical protein
MNKLDAIGSSSTNWDDLRKKQIADILAKGTTPISNLKILPTYAKITSCSSDTASRISAAHKI